MTNRNNEFAHYGDPCLYCGINHDDVAAGPCSGDRITLSRAQAQNLLDYLKKGAGPAGWPTTLWLEVQQFISDVDALLAPGSASEATPVAWRYRWKIEGEWTNWRVSDASQKSADLMGLEEVPLYAHPIRAA